MNYKTINKFLGHKRAWLLCGIGALLMMAGCTNDEFMQQPQTPSGEGIPFTATISAKAATRAIDNTTLATSWAANEQVALIHNGVVDVMTVSKVGDDGAATITGTITGSPKDGDEVQVVYPASAVDTKTKEVKTNLLAEQDGTLATIASDLDLRTASGAKLKVGPASATINGAVSLTNKLAIVKFSLKEQAVGTPAVAAEKFMIRDNGGQTITTVTPSTAASELYVAMEPVSNKTFRFNAEGNNMVYSYFKKGATLAAGTYYQSPISMENISKVPLTLEATVNETTITVINKTQAEQAGIIDYKTINVNGDVVENNYINSGGTGQITINTGEKVTFFGNSQRYGHDPYESGFPSNITCNKDCYIYGNIMSLINSTDYATLKTLSEAYTFECLFIGTPENPNRIKNHPSKELLLPATTLTIECYSGLFQGTGLTAAPDLPATTLAQGCYDGMFSNCTELTTLPEDFLPATTLAQGCYNRMFQGCTGLTAAPDLPATTLSGNCYLSMFQDCTGLTTAPVLPATTLAPNCYTDMFWNCTKLSSVTCLATDLPNDAGFYLYGWLDGAGTAEGCERKLYIDPATNLTDDKWQLASSGEEGKRWTVATSNFVAKSCAISELTTKEIGWRLGSDGVAYEPVGILPDGVKARAIIAYVGKVDKYFDHFLAIALEDVDNNNHTWADALTAVGTYADNHPISIESTIYNTSTTGSTYYDRVASDQTTTSATRTTAAQTGWRLPSVTDWRYIFEGLGRIKGGLTLTAKKGDTTYSSDARPTNPLGVLDGMYYHKNGDPVGNSSLRAAINSACGNTALQSFGYWSSSEHSNDSDPGAWDYNFNGGAFWWSSTIIFNVRAVFAY